MLEIWRQGGRGLHRAVAHACKGPPPIFFGSSVGNTWHHIAKQWLVAEPTARHLEGGCKGRKGGVGLRGRYQV